MTSSHVSVVYDTILAWASDVQIMVHNLIKADSRALRGSGPAHL